MTLWRAPPYPSLPAERHSRAPINNMPPDSASDREILGQIEELFAEKEKTPFDEDYNSFIETLSFSRTDLGERDSTELKIAWTNFLRATLEDYTSWGWPCTE